MHTSLAKYNSPNQIECAGHEVLRGEKINDYSDTVVNTDEKRPLTMPTGT